MATWTCNSSNKIAQLIPDLEHLHVQFDSRWREPQLDVNQTSIQCFKLMSNRRRSQARWNLKLFNSFMICVEIYCILSIFGSYIRMYKQYVQINATLWCVCDKIRLILGWVWQNKYVCYSDGKNAQWTYRNLESPQLFVVSYAKFCSNHFVRISVTLSNLNYSVLELIAIVCTMCQHQGPDSI